MTSVAMPAIEDDFTARLFAVAVRRTRLAAPLGVFTFLLAAVTLVGILVPATMLWLVGTAVFPCYAAVFWRLDTLTEPGTARWPEAMRQLLTTQAWRETPALVLNTRGTVLVLPGPEYVRVHGMTAAAREVVVRTGRVWVVGPDAEGKLAVRVDGSWMPRPARRVPPQQATAALPTQEPITAMWVRPIVDLMSWTVLATTVAVAEPVIVMSSDPPWWGYLVVAVDLVATVVCWSRFRRVRRLRHTGPWVRADAETPSWQAHANGLADGTIPLRFADGRKFTARLNRVPLDLFANVTSEKALWLTDRGVVGFPNYPVVATARMQD